MVEVKLMQDDKLRCQSCGMPLSVETFGTNASGTFNEEYCKFCFQKGGFTDPDMTLPRMIQMSQDNMVKDMHMSPEKAQELAISVIPNLKRWRNTQI